MEQAFMTIMSLTPVFPELLLLVGAMGLLMAGVFQDDEASRHAKDGMSMLSIFFMAAAIFMLALPNEGGDLALLGDKYILDDFARLMKILALAGAALTLLISRDYLRHAKLMMFEYPVLILFSCVGMMMMISANDLIMLYLGLELQSLALYVFAAMRRDSVRSSEAGLKYFVLGALSSGFLLYGCSLIYGFTGTTIFPEIANSIQEGEIHLGLIFGLVFLIAGIAFKISAVPFHMWTPDVYEGSPTAVTAFFAAAPKIAAMALLLRLLFTAFPTLSVQWQQIIAFLSIASMALGAFAAIGQRNIKRLMAYSSIGHMGFALVGLAAGSENGVHSVILYMVIYLIMTLGTFACLLAMRRSEGMVEDIDELAGLSRNNLPMAFLLSMLLFSLAGIPPLAGFFAKFYVFLAAVHAGLYPLAILGVLSSVVGAYYYLRIIKIMFFDEPTEHFEPMPQSLTLVLGLSGVFVLCYVFYPAPLMGVVDVAAKALF